MSGVPGLKKPGTSALVIKNMKKVLNIGLIVILVIIMVGGFVHTFFLPVEINEYENRYANKVKTFSIDSYLDGSFQDSIELALADQIPFSEAMKKAYNTVNSEVVKEALNIVLAETENQKDRIGSDKNNAAEEGSADANEGLFTIANCYGLENEPELLSVLGTAPGQTLMSKNALNDGNKYIKLAGSTYIFGTDHLCVYQSSIFGNENDRQGVSAVSNIEKNETFADFLEAKAENYNSLIKKFPKLDYYAYYIKSDADINLEQGKTCGFDSYIFDRLDIPRQHTASYDVSCFAEFDNLFYKTDHHWNYKGSYYAYTELAKLMNFKGNLIRPLTYSQSEYTPLVITDASACNQDAPIEITLGSFSGSRATGVGTGYSEPFTVFQFDFPKYKITANGNDCYDYGNQESLVQGYAAGKEPQLSYGFCYGYDLGLVTIEQSTPDENTDGNILIIGESYDNALLKLIAAHYKKLVSVDLRNYEAENGRKFDFAGCIEEHNIDTVLFIGSQSFWTRASFNCQ